MNVLLNRTQYDNNVQFITNDIILNECDTIPNIYGFLIIIKYVNLKRSMQDFENVIGGVIDRLLASSAVDLGFESRTDQSKDYQTGINRFSAKRAAIRRKSNYWFARNQDSESVWSGLLFQCASTIKIQLSMLV